MHIHDLPTPCYVVDEQKLVHNLSILKSIMNSTGCRILLAQKAFSMHALYPLIGQYLTGTAASGVFEARLGATRMGGETHVFSPAYRDEDFPEILSLCGHIVFNSFSQLKRFGSAARAAGRSVGLRLNPECSTQEGHAQYDPCSPLSRLGVTREQFLPNELDGVDGFHMHTLCEQNSDALETTVAALEEKFGEWIGGMKWLNLGGGHHITRTDYDIARLERIIMHLSQKYGVQVYLEPGEAVALNAGYLLTTVLDTLHNGMDIAILDASAACHMPDVLEMPYRPPLQNSGLPAEKPHTYRLAGPTCLAGDIIGDYSFDKPLRPSDRLTFNDMAIYTMVKNNTFNGMPLPSIAVLRPNGSCHLVRQFDYSDFENRLS